MDGLKRADRLVQGLRKSIAELQIRSNDFGHGNGVIRFRGLVYARQIKVVPRVFSSFTGLRKPFFYIKTRQEEMENEKRLRRITRTRLY